MIVKMNKNYSKLWWSRATPHAPSAGGLGWIPGHESGIPDTTTKPSRKQTKKNFFVISAFKNKILKKIKPSIFPAY